MKILRTPDECFANLDGYDFEPHYTTVDAGDGTALRIHHVEVGPREAEPILLMHGNPSWSYLYRRLIPGLAASGRRVIAVDLVGCGRSDKPAERGDYTLARHYDWMTQWLEAMDLKNITLFCQDWGGTIGLYLVSIAPGRFDRVVAANTGLPLGEGAGKFMTMWTEMMREATSFPWDMFRMGVSSGLSEAAMKAYLAPFPEPAYQAGILQFPALIAVQVDNPGAPINRAAWERLASFDKPFLTLWGAKDPAARGADLRLQAHIPGAKGQPHFTFAEANHFIQEDVPDELVEHTLRFLGATS
jgi:haloalkane dehalogenase